MAIIDTITNDNHFWDWLQQTDNRTTQFSYEGANALQAKIHELSEDVGENIEFDPVAWCVEYTEYDSLGDAYKAHYGDGSDLPEEQKRTTEEQQVEYFQENTEFIELENGHVIIRDF